jgi:LysR family carnitine catabolism transcriptional activator
MNVTVKQLRIFTEVARQLSFAAAASHLHLSQPAVSLAIQNLEQHIGGRLFDRTTRHLQLTPEGQLFYPKAQQLLNQWSQALGDVNSLFALKRGNLSLSVMPSFASNDLADIVAKYHQQYPHINLAIDNIVMDQAIDNVRQGRCELAVIFAGQNMQGVHFQPLFKDRFMMIYSDHHQAQLQDCDLDADLSPFLALPMVAMDANSSVRRWVDDAIKKYEVAVNIVAQVNQLETLGRFVAKGIGVGIVPSLCAQQMQDLGLHMQPLSQAFLCREVGVVSPMNQSVSQAAQAMVDMLKAHYA